MDGMGDALLILDHLQEYRLTIRSQSPKPCSSFPFSEVLAQCMSDTELGMQLIMNGIYIYILFKYIGTLLSNIYIIYSKSQFCFHMFRQRRGQSGIKKKSDTGL